MADATTAVIVFIIATVVIFATLTGGVWLAVRTTDHRRGTDKARDAEQVTRRGRRSVFSRH